ncbi:hypothetical protein ACU6RQ_08040 [Zobellella denitrificans]
MNLSIPHSEKKEFIVISETVFCDVEKEEKTLDEYYSRLLLCVESMKNISSEVELIHVIYISKDKSKYIEKLQKLLDDEQSSNIKIVTYEHPTSGYKFKEDAHIDLLKNPNRSPRLRDELFKKANIDASNYREIIRIAIDDDDIWLSRHIEKIVELSKNLSTQEDDCIYGIALMDTYIAYISESNQSILIEDVLLNRAICGNKFYYSKSWNEIKKWSPWSFPDKITPSVRENFKKKNVTLIRYQSDSPTFVYIRRGKNLSSQNKTWCTDEIRNRQNITSLNELISKNKTQPRDNFKISEYTPSTELKLERDNKKIFLTSNLNEVYSKGAKFSFYLYKDNKVIEKTPYQSHANVTFEVEIKDGVYQAACFILDDKKNKIRESTNKVKISQE